MSYEEQSPAKSESKAPAESTGKDSGSGAEPADKRSDVEQDEVIQSRAFDRHDTYVTTINGNVNSENFGIGNFLSRRHRTGPLDERELREARRFFQTPPSFGDAAALIAVENLVVLCGREGSGRRCAAISLLDGAICPGADRNRFIELLDPQMSLGALLDYSFVKGGRYLLADYSLTAGETQTRFEIGLLQQRLRTAGAFLVLTTAAAPRVFDSRGIPWIQWRPTSAADVFAAQIDQAEIEEDEEQVSMLHRVLAIMSLARVSTFIDDFRSHGLVIACLPFGDHARQRLREWLDDQPEVPSLVPVVTAALLPGVVEGEHERRAADLAEAIDRGAGRDRSDADYCVDLQPSRWDRRNLVHRTPDPLRPSARIVVMADDLSPEAVLHELYVRYGEELWGPVQNWLHDQPLGGDYRVIGSLATGMAALECVDVGLADSVLENWASDSEDDRRWAAAVANSELCANDRTVLRAWLQAVRWSTETGQPQRIAAAHAFSLKLSEHRPAEAVSRLWNLALGDAIVAIWARAELTAVVRRATVVEGRLRRVLVVIGRQLDYLTDAGPEGESLIDRSLTTIARILTIRVADKPLTAYALGQDAGLVQLVGHLWAQLLRSWPHRIAALDELHAARLLLDEPAAAALGDAIHGDLSPAEWQWLCRDLGTDTRTRTDVVGVVG